MASPTIFTRTPIEGVIQATGMEAQVAIASTILGTPVFWGGAMVLFMWRFGDQLYKVGVGDTTALQGVRRTTIAFAMVLIGWAMLGSRVATPVHSGPLGRGGVWEELPGVTANEAYSPLVSGSDALWGYAFINTVIEELTGQVHGAVQAAADAPEPTDQILGLMSLQATSLGVDHADVATNFNRLSTNCRAGQSAKILERGAGARDLFDLTTGDCRDMWDAFDGSFQAAKSTMLLDMANKFGDADNLAVSELSVQAGVDLFGAGTSEGDIENVAFSIAMENFINEQAGRTGLNSQRQNAATFSEGSDAGYEAAASGLFGEAALGVLDMLPWTGDVHAKARKAEAAAKFNEYADLIPSLRGFLHALFAVVYPLCAYAFACGFTRPFMAWLGGRMLLGLYSPASTLLYGMTASLTQQSRIGNDPTLGWVTNDEFTLGGVALLESEILRIQSSYLMCEMAVFAGFLIGSATILRGGFQTGSSIQGGAAGAARGARAVAGVVSGGVDRVVMGAQGAGRAAGAVHARYRPAPASGRPALGGDGPRPSAAASRPRGNSIPVQGRGRLSGSSSKASRGRQL